MKTAVLGSGAIGCLVAGYLKLKDEDVVLIGHRESVQVIRKSGLSISGVRGDFKINIETAEKLTSQPELIILATKTQDIDAALQENKEFLENAALLITQNGIAADEIAARHIPKENIVSSIIMFGATYSGPGKVIHNFDRSWIIGGFFKPDEESVKKIESFLGKAFPVVVVGDIKGMKYLKIFLNANNCIPAILGKCMQEVFSDMELSRISIAIWKEALDIITKSGIKLASLPDFPLERLYKLTSLPALEAAKIFSLMMTGLSKEPLYGSILQSIQRKRLSEIDYINGEFVGLAQKNNLPVPLNGKLVEMVHQVEQQHRFFTKEELLHNIEGLFN